jgi:hypothetical protein
MHGGRPHRCRASARSFLVVMLSHTLLCMPQVEHNGGNRDAGHLHNVGIVQLLDGSRD